jgi:poly-beta-1,6-N-acetyl-D-glucosamine synthase
MTALSIIYIFKLIFWTSFFVVFYSYIGYGLLMILLVSLKRVFRKNKVKVAPEKDLPPLAVVIAAYNEEEYITQKIENTLALDYPRDKLEIVFVTDGSTDKTPDLVRQYPGIIIYHQSERKGKVAAINRILPFVKSPLILFCDANTFLNKNCATEIVKHYIDPRVGGVAGEKKIFQTVGDSAAAAGEGLYWKYESFLKKLDSDFYTTVGAAGELFSVRKELIEEVPEGTIIEDFVQSLSICRKGFVVRYEPNAYAKETASASIREEMKRKVRICAGAFQAMVLLKELFNVFKYPIVSFQFISHRILRWTLCPIALVLLLVSNFLIVLTGGNLFYQIMLFLQVIFYGMAIAGWIFANKDIRVKILYIPFYFVFMNAAVFIGFGRYIRKKQTVVWDKAARQKLA